MVASVTPALIPVAIARGCVTFSMPKSFLYKAVYCSLAANLVARFGASTIMGAAIPRYKVAGLDSFYTVNNSISLQEENGLPFFRDDLLETLYDSLVAISAQLCASLDN